MSYDVHVTYVPQEVAYRLVVAQRLSGDRVGVMSPPEFTAVEPHSRIPPEKVWVLDDLELLKAFAQAAWDEGWRPKGFDTTDMNAMKAHLEDKREEVRWLRDRIPRPQE